MLALKCLRSLISWWLRRAQINTLLLAERIATVHFTPLVSGRFIAPGSAAANSSRLTASQQRIAMRDFVALSVWECTWNRRAGRASTICLTGPSLAKTA